MIRQFLKNVKEYGYFCRYMAKTSLKAEVANSYLNWIWWVLEPLASMLVYYLIFSRLLGRGQDYYVVFIYTGTLIWSYFERCMLFDVQAIRLNRDIVTKTYIPKPMLVISNMMFNNMKMLISVGILILLMVIKKVILTPYVLFVIPMIILLQLFVFGIGMICMHFGVFVDDLAHAMRIGLHILFYLTGIFYNLRTLLPDPWGTWIVRINPMAAIIYNLRNSLLYGQAPELWTTLLWSLLSLGFCYAGIRLSYCHENTYVKVI